MENKSMDQADGGGLKSVKRRDVLKGLAGLPVLGVFFYEALNKLSADHRQKRMILSELDMSEDAPAILPKTTVKKRGELIRLGIIGFGTRGEQLARALGFAHPEWIEDKRKSRAGDKSKSELADWFEQEDLNVAITGICDVFDERAERGMVTSRSTQRPDSAPALSGAKRFRYYRDMLASPEIDAVIITTPDFHHAQMTIDAANAGKHVYCEKCMTRTEEEVYQVEAAIKNSRIAFQLGHQFSQNDSFARAKEIIARGILGKITLVETTSNRNTTNGAWVRHLNSQGQLKSGSPQSIDWEQWLGTSPMVPFSLERYYNWTLWWEYATGLSGQLMSHEFNAVNQLLRLGIPHSCVASGGIYFHKDHREIPDIFHAVFEFPERDLTLSYSASLANNRNRGRIFMGHDASMELGESLTIMADEDSTRYQEKLKSGIIDPTLPLFTFQPGRENLDVVTTATERYYASRGLSYTFRNGRRVDLAHLHLKEWLDAIRHGTPVSCPIEKGVETTIACHMATRSYRQQCRVTWDAVNRKIMTT